ncbi:MAG: hypothetical protein Q8P41_18575 [Pseudomonadota bacterium]|nr:hypothetical protein [Pseudomonadota bacterium]
MRSTVVSRCIVTAAALALTGCEEPLPAPSLVVACDPTGPSPGDVCNRPLLARVAKRWAAEAVATPGASLRALLVGKDYSSTQVGTTLSVPLAFEQDPLLALPAWQASVVETFAAMPVVHEEPATRRVMRSDLVSLVALASVDARPAPGAVTLLLASDGRLVSAGLNAEERVPASGTVLARVAKGGVAIDLSVFSSVVICGVHHVGLSAGEHAALQGLWRELITAWGGPAPTIVSSCDGVESLLFTAPSPAPSSRAPAESGAVQESGQ